MVDMKVVGPFDCEFFVMESAPTANHSDSGNKYWKDRNKLGRHMNDMLWYLEKKSNPPTQCGSSGFQMLGSLTTGIHWSVFGMTHQGYLSFLTLQEKVSIPKSRRDIRSLINAMKLAMRVHTFLDLQGRAAYLAGSKSTDDLCEGTVMPCMFSPKKLEKGKRGKDGIAANYTSPVR